MKPYFGRILIEPLESESVLEQVDEKYQNIGRVMAIGGFPEDALFQQSPDGVVSPLSPEPFFKVGDLIAYDSFGMSSVTYKGKEYFTLLQDSDFILGKMDEIQTTDQI